jgi:hypothetical protein
MKPLGRASLEGAPFLVLAALDWRIARPTHHPTFLSFPKSTAAQHPRSPQPRTPLRVANHPRQA